ncbi:MAG: GHKL domain-containing protein [Pseudobutyrivibrio sp.]|nr:GHKL domain-containing protein [Pseudobutyrivibrio sp.]
MGEINSYIWIVLAIYLVRGIVGFANFWMVFEYFCDFPKLDSKKKDWFGISFYAIITLLHRFAINSENRIFFVIIGGLFFIRIIPFLWNRYGRNLGFLIQVLFYECIVDGIAQNIEFLFIKKINIVGYFKIQNDISEVITEIIICGFLMTLILLKRVNVLKICFTTLTIPEHIILFLICAAYGTLQLEVYVNSSSSDFMRKLSVLTFVLLMMVISHIIMVRDQNISMNNMIGNLKEPMKQITDSYIEMNEKNTELRRFRHDTKNLLIGLRSLIADGKFEQAVGYIDKMQDSIEASRSKAFDTGNFIADALIESKAKVATQNNIVLTVSGNIPTNRIEDVNLVILISNLLDNAIEAAKQVEGERKIEIQSILKKNIWILSVKNSCVKDIVIKENKIKTTKENKEAHGFGISNVERVTKKYDGNLLLSCENQVFTARATLMLTA